MSVATERRSGMLNKDNEVKTIPEILRHDQVRVLIPYNTEIARYNAAVFQVEKGAMLILVRAVNRGSVRSGTPDRGKLELYRSTPERVERVAPLDLSYPGVNNWEDARAFASGRNVVIGLTAIRDDDNKPIAAMVRGNITEGNLSLNDESLAVCFNDKGKNMTPISINEFLFRRESSRNSLEVVEVSKDKDGQNKLDVKKVIPFPKKSWCEWSIGTQAQILEGGILPIHGVNKFSLGVDLESGKEVDGYAYSLGLARLDENLNVIGMTDIPLWTRESFKNILPMGQELDTNKDVIYCCGYSVEGDIVKFVVNIGDLMTVEVAKSMAELKAALDRSSKVNQEELLQKAA